MTLHPVNTAPGKKWEKRAALLMLTAAVFVSGVIKDAHSAYTYTYNYTWDEFQYPESYGRNAGTCTLTYPNNYPLAQSRTLIVDNNLPNGSVLYSWNYDDFLPNFAWNCTSSGISQPANTIRTHTGVRTNAPSFAVNTYLLNSAGQLYSADTYRTSIDGIGLRLYVKVLSDTNYDLGLCNSNTNPIEAIVNNAWFYNPAVGSEFVLASNNYAVINLRSNTYCDRISSGSTYINSHTLNGRVGFSVRGELVKIGNITSSGALTVTGASAGSTQVLPTALGLVSPGPLLAGNGIIIQTPSCRLRGATDYQIDLGRWLHAGPGSHQPGISLPAYGDTKPVNINIECSGLVDNVEFSFQDTGATPLSNRNISVYDSIGGQQIDGLEIEMLYSGTRLNVHKISETPTAYKVNTGSQGSVKTNPSDTSFHSQSQAQFGARFVQRSAITKGGSSYTGPVTGQVNMFVTYY